MSGEAYRVKIILFVEYAWDKVGDIIPLSTTLILPFVPSIGMSISDGEVDYGKVESIKYNIKAGAAYDFVCGLEKQYMIGYTREDVFAAFPSCQQIQ